MQAQIKGFNNPPEIFRVLREKDICQNGEYRTRRLVPAAWGRLEANGAFRTIGM